MKFDGHSISHWIWKVRHSKRSGNAPAARFQSIRKTLNLEDAVLRVVRGVLMDGFQNPTLSDITVIWLLKRKQNNSDSPQIQDPPCTSKLRN